MWGFCSVKNSLCDMMKMEIHLGPCVTWYFYQGFFFNAQTTLYFHFFLQWNWYHRWVNVTENASAETRVKISYFAAQFRCYTTLSLFCIMLHTILHAYPFSICFNFFLVTFCQTELFQCILVVLFTLKCASTLLTNYFWNVTFYYMAANLQRMCLWWQHKKFHHFGNCVFLWFELYTWKVFIAVMSWIKNSAPNETHIKNILRILKSLNSYCRIAYMCQ